VSAAGDQLTAALADWGKDTVHSVAAAGQAVADAAKLVLAERNQLAADLAAWDQAAATSTGHHAATIRRLLSELAVVTAERDEAETSLLQEIGNRDAYGAAADKLAYTIAPVAEIGEHSSCNDPWANAVNVAAELRRIKTGAGCTCGWGADNPHEAYCPLRPVGSVGVV
jgi:hypothetical protein